MPVLNKHLRNVDPRTPCIVAMKRTAFTQYSLVGKNADRPGKQGKLGSQSAVQLGEAAIRGMFKGLPVDMTIPQIVSIGNVIQAGQGQAPGRQAAVNAGISENVPAHTINKMCASGMASIVDVARMIWGNEIDWGVAGGIESMSQAPFMFKDTDRSKLLFDPSDENCTFSAADFTDAMMRDGLDDAWSGNPMWQYGNLIATDQKYTKEMLDAEAALSYSRSQKAQADGIFAKHIVPVETASGLVTEDDEPGKFAVEDIPGRKGIENGLISTASASSTDDGAAVVLVSSVKVALDNDCEVLALINGWADYAMEPQWFTKCPVGAAQDVLDRSDLMTSSIDLWEVNEAFASVSLYFKDKLGLSDDVVNIYGGAVSLGHPVGASGARIIMHLIEGLEARGGGKGVASICYGGGGALATLLEVA